MEILDFFASDGHPASQEPRQLKKACLTLVVLKGESWAKKIVIRESYHKVALIFAYLRCRNSGSSWRTVEWASWSNFGL